MVDALAGTVHDFRVARAHRPVVVDAREHAVFAAHFLDRQPA
jgi:hypothetical protein